MPYWCMCCTQVYLHSCITCFRSTYYNHFVLGRFTMYNNYTPGVRDVHHKCDVQSALTGALCTYSLRWEFYHMCKWHVHCTLSTNARIYSALTVRTFCALIEQFTCTVHFECTKKWRFLYTVCAFTDAQYTCALHCACTHKYTVHVQCNM